MHFTIKKQLFKVPFLDLVTVAQIDGLAVKPLGHLIIIMSIYPSHLSPQPMGACAWGRWEEWRELAVLHSYEVKH